MTAAGTGVAAGVAQTAANAQQVGRQRDRAATRDAVEAKRLRELFESHMQALEEGDTFESPAQLHIDGHLPEHPNQQQPGKMPAGHAQPAAEETQVVRALPPPPPKPGATADPLYHHLDIEA